MRGPFGVLVALLLVGLTAAPAGAAAPSPAPWDAARSAALAACPATVDLYDTEGRPLARPLPRGTRLLIEIQADRPNVLALGAHDLNRAVELVLSAPATETAPLLINVDTALLDDRFTWFVPQVRSIGGGLPGELMWHFPTAERVLLLGPARRASSSRRAPTYASRPARRRARHPCHPRRLPCRALPRQCRRRPVARPRGCRAGCHRAGHRRASHRDGIRPRAPPVPAGRTTPSCWRTSPAPPCPPSGFRSS
ncbi:collagen-binding domain-containing protein [Catellatospora bangladeshensis]|uniref:collagen-binding domain-containing protein n=1 Tax=Catellatospora bangladeshensis TaxID=310355 RepID=UPI003605F258